ncbi:MAG: DUF4330 domain-containing protein [Clostridiaceae bacterium]|nr:DUF4330 domain-containing protein [Clostridiaceae bacterium]
MEEKKTVKKRFTLLDAVIILVVIAALAFVAYKMMPTGSTAAYEDVTLSFYAPDVPDYVAEQLYVGAPVVDADRNVYLGKVVDIQIEDSVFWSANDEGIQTVSPMDDYRAVTITTRVSGEASAYGIRLSSVEYSVGHTLAIRAGFAKISCAVSDLDYDNPSVPENIAKSITG